MYRKQGGGARLQTRIRNNFSDGYFLMKMLTEIASSVKTEGKSGFPTFLRKCVGGKDFFYFFPSLSGTKSCRALKEMHVLSRRPQGSSFPCWRGVMLVLQVCSSPCAPAWP